MSSRLNNISLIIVRKINAKQICNKRKRPFDFYGDRNIFLKKKIRAGLRNNKYPGRITNGKKQDLVRAEKEKEKKAERLKRKIRGENKKIEY